MIFFFELQGKNWFTLWTRKKVDFELGRDIGEDVIGLDTSLGRRKSICSLGVNWTPDPRIPRSDTLHMNHMDT